LLFDGIAVKADFVERDQPPQIGTYLFGYDHHDMAE